MSQNFTIQNINPICETTGDYSAQDYSLRDLEQRLEFVNSIVTSNPQSTKRSSTNPKLKAPLYKSSK